MTVLKNIGCMIGTLFAIEISNMLISPKFKSYSQFEQLVLKESKKLEIDSEIKINFNSEFSSCKIKDNRYYLNINKYLATRATVRHELYHLKYHTKSSNYYLNLIKYIFYEEPSAIIYSHLNIKL